MGRRKAFVMAGLGFEMVFSPVIGLFAGSWLDTRWGTAPWLLIVGLILGTLAAVRTGFRLYRMGMAFAENPDGEVPPNGKGDRNENAP